MKPAFKIIADDVDITDKIKDRLLSLNITDKAGIESDSVEIVLDDRNQILFIPTTEAKLEIWLGTTDNLIKQGIYIVDEVGLTSPPASLTINAHAADMSRNLKVKKTRSFDAITIGDLVKLIASEHSLTPAIATDYTSVQLTNLSQTNESDLNLLTRIAKEHDCIAKPANGFLIFAPHAKAKSVAGQSLSTISITNQDITSWRYSTQDRGKYQAVTAKWYDESDAKTKTVTAGTGDPIFTISKQFQDENTAWRAATAKLNALSRGTATISITMPGKAQLFAEGKLNLNGLRQGVDGTNYIITSVKHVLNNSGFQTQLEAELKP